jgi:ATP-binding cassette subfamily F protein uup
MLEAKLADGTLFAKDPASFNKVAADLEILRQSVAKMEDEWLELEMMRSEVEGA